jgi:hypothetical protein
MKNSGHPCDLNNTLVQWPSISMCHLYPKWISEFKVIVALNKYDRSPNKLSQQKLYKNLSL